MPTYAYKALEQDGQSVRGTVAAASRREALERLLNAGRHVFDLREVLGPAGGGGWALRLGRRRTRLSALTRQLATLCASGVPLLQSLDVLIHETPDPRQRHLLSEIRAAVWGGSTLADALREHPRVFPRVMVGMVRVGEVGGTLDGILTQLADLFERQEALRSEVRAALAYPLLILGLGLGSAAALVAFLIPRLAVLFEGAGQALPAPTRALMWIAGAITSHGVVLLLGLVAVLAALCLSLRAPRVRMAADRLKLRLPWIGRLITNVSIARFARLLGTITHGGVSVVEGLDIVAGATGNQVIAAAITEMSRRIRHGDSLAGLMRSSGVFPALPVQMVAVGEETGRLDQMFLRVAETYEREATVSTRTMTSLLAPVILLAVAALVGFIVLAMLLPIFQMSSVVA